LSDGRSIVIPIINGWSPSVFVTYDPDGSERHVFNYGERNVWKGDTHWTENKVKPEANRTNVRESPVLEPIPRRTNQNSQLKLPTRETSPFLRRPSDVQSFTNPIVQR